jgi:hypothetical protein
MKTVFRLVVRCYPRQWRERYGAELDALIEDAQPGWRGVCDVAREGMMMRITRGWGTFAAYTAVGAAIGGLVWLAQPVRFVSSATLRLPASAAAHDSAEAERWRAALRDALNDVDDRRGTAVTLNRSEASAAVVSISHRASTASDAQAVLERLVAATLMATDPLADGANVRHEPVTAGRQSVAPLVFGSMLGLVAGAAAVVVRSRRRV